MRYRNLDEFEARSNVSPPSDFRFWLRIGQPILTATKSSPIPAAVTKSDTGDIDTIERRTPSRLP
jgi:hypothetical protein